jgi:hypothetical protein
VRACQHAGAVVAHAAHLAGAVAQAEHVVGRCELHHPFGDRHAKERAVGGDAVGQHEVAVGVRRPAAADDRRGRAVDPIGHDEGAWPARVDHGRLGLVMTEAPDRTVRTPHAADHVADGELRGAFEAADRARRRGPAGALVAALAVLPAAHASAVDDGTAVKGAQRDRGRPAEAGHDARPALHARRTDHAPASPQRASPQAGCGDGADIAKARKAVTQSATDRDLPIGVERDHLVARDRHVDHVRKACDASGLVLQLAAPARERSIGEHRAGSLHTELHRQASSADPRFLGRGIGRGLGRRRRFGLERSERGGGGGRRCGRRSSGSEAWSQRRLGATARGHEQRRAERPQVDPTGCSVRRRHHGNEPPPAFDVNPARGALARAAPQVSAPRCRDTSQRAS